MKKIFRRQKLILIVFSVIFLQLLFSTDKNVSIIHSAQTKVGEIIFGGGHFRAVGNPSMQGGHCCGFDNPDKCSKGGTWPGVAGDFTPDTACQAAFPGSIAGNNLGYYGSNQYICGSTFNPEGTSIIECLSSAPPPADPPPAAANPPAPAAANPPAEKEPLPPPLSPPCADWKDGACTKVATSLFQGKNKSDGDISTDPGQFIVRILAIILSFAGGIALLLIISAGYKIMTSKGKPEGIQQGRDQLISAIVGLVFIIFSFVIFQLVFTDILKIPGIS